jgi:hypothetical protein
MGATDGCQSHRLRGATRRWSVAVRAVSDSRRKPSAVVSLIHLNEDVALHRPMAALNLTANARSKAATFLRLY